MPSACSSPERSRPAAEIATATEGRTCSVEAMPELPDVKLTSVTEVSAAAPHCRVLGVIGTETNFELLLPDDWNGKFVMGGGGGFVGSVVNTAMAFGPLQKGYATVGTDTGHRGSVLDASWALNNLERVVSFGHQAVHRTAVTAKALIAGFYGREVSRSVFVGCSRGGGQALMEAQRYPDDFDGIVAGAPAYNWTEELGGRNTWLNQAMYPDPSDLSVATITPEARALIGNAVLEGCDRLDGLEDGVLNNPLACDFDATALACQAGKPGACLAPAQLEAARRAYEGLSLDGERIVPGYPPGAELGAGGWDRWFAGGLAVTSIQEFQRGVPPDPEFPDPEAPNAHFAFGNGVMKYLVFQDPDWDYSTYDFSTFQSDVAWISSTLDATDPDLDAFRERGGKLLLYNGWRDMALTPLGTIDYYEKVVKRDASASTDVRLILVPGMDHCFGGPGPSFVDWLDEIERWLENGRAPDHVTAYWVDEEMQPEGSRLACAYPNVLEYDGIGDPRDAASFRCHGSE
jgi:feruloyl esterase